MAWWWKALELNPNKVIDNPLLLPLSAFPYGFYDGINLTPIGVNIQTHTLTHIFIHTDTYTYRHTHSHTHVRTQHAHIHTRTYSHTLTHTNTSSHTNTNSLTHILHIHSYTQSHVHSHKLKHTHTHTSMIATIPQLNTAFKMSIIRNLQRSGYSETSLDRHPRLFGNFTFIHHWNASRKVVSESPNSISKLDVDALIVYDVQLQCEPCQSMCVEVG